MATVEADGKLGDVLRYWRRLRGKSQLDLALAAMTTPRYVSFVETGRSQPSRQMVVRLARALEIPLRERNAVLLAAGYAPLYPMRALDAPEFERVQFAVTAMLEQHEPFPAVLMDRAWNVVRANRGAQRLFGGILAPEPVPEPANVLDLMIAAGPVRDAVLNWPAVAAALLERARREAVGGVLDPDTAARVERLGAQPGVAGALEEATSAAVTSPVIDVQFAFEGAQLSFFSVVTTIGTPTDVTAQEMRLEAFFAADAETHGAWTNACAD